MTAECTCLPYCAGGYGPEEDCPVHGRHSPLPPDHDEPCMCGTPFTCLADEHAAVMTPSNLRGVPNTPGTPRRTIRITDALWNAAAEKAAEKGQSVSDVIRAALERYVKR